MYTLSFEQISAAVVANDLVKVRDCLLSDNQENRQGMAREILFHAKLGHLEKLLFLLPLAEKGLSHPDREVCEAMASVLAKVAVKQWENYQSACCSPAFRELLRKILKIKHQNIRKGVIQVLVAEALWLKEIDLARELLTHPAQKIQLAAITSMGRCAQQGVSLELLWEDLLEQLHNGPKKISKQAGRTLVFWIEESPFTRSHRDAVVRFQAKLVAMNSAKTKDLLAACEMAKKRNVIEVEDFSGQTDIANELESSPDTGDEIQESGPEESGQENSTQSYTEQDFDKPISSEDIDWEWVNETGLTEGLNPTNRGDYDILLQRIAEARSAQKMSYVERWKDLAKVTSSSVMKHLKDPGHLNQQLDNGYTPLTLAIDMDLIDVVRFLLENGADPNRKDKALSKAQSPLSWALGRDSQIFDALIAAGANVNGRQGNRSILDYYIDYSWEAPNGYELVEKLLKAGANPMDGCSFPLVRAVARNSPESVLRALLERGVDIDAVHPDPNVGSALHAAVESDRPDIVLFLLQSGANPLVTDAFSRTPLQLARETGNEQICQLL